ncbi:flagellar assembly protein FliH [Gilvimarinus sp. SDUM040013]|uniref:Flagellar assembly protein FliH n=1 Tax=Gilvimarinus gilvus TaxID=3058038 RepID=A0ABU4RU82_9GAMM|nr:flagellar assembly protein FliH [Gilvimarinus sp. SDUM040013]MDO3385060.1 flagellar assembly protein FliH [Gilvimarinus sp. SDUM040013]MDX6848435.1 flagellar assembly protein FliH [Gilvimarinus sp. SDUM040013]
MKDSKANPNRIPASQSETWESWTMPVIGDDGQVLNAQRRQALEGEAESIEEVDVDALAHMQSLTAEQLADIVKNAEEEGFAQGHAEGVKTGYDEGFKSGQQQGLLEMRQQLIAEQKTFQSIATSLFEPIEQQDDLLESLLLTSIERLARAVVMKELTTDRGDIVALVRKAVASLPTGREKITVHLNPDDLAIVQRYCEEHALEWRFHANPDIAAGGVKVITSDSTVDCSVERRLDEIIAAFKTQQNVDEVTANEDLVAAPADDAEDLNFDAMPTEDDEIYSANPSQSNDDRNAPLNSDEQEQDGSVKGTDNE